MGKENSLNEGKERIDLRSIYRYCKFCDKKFVILQKNKKYCSDTCKKKASYKRHLVRNPRKKKVTEKRRCNFCRAYFNWCSSIPYQIYCSEECSKHKSKRRYSLATRGIIKKNNGKSFNYLKLRFNVFKRDSFTCQYCGRSVISDKIKLHVDHVKSKKRGGENTFDNLITSCEDCNLGKGDVLLNARLIEKHNYYED